ncbi:MAG: hypothetical protein AAFZ05_11470 [Pseudomonadota bacterium]
MTSLRRSLLVVLAIAQFAVPALPNFVDGLTPIQGISGQVPPPEQPAGYAFSIWFVIFALILVYAVRQLLPVTRNAVLDEKIGWLAVGATATNVLWMALAITLGSGWYLVAVIFTILAFALATLFVVLAGRAHWSAFDRWITQPAFAVLAGWLSAAVWLNLASQLRQSAIPAVAAQSTETIGVAVIGAVTITGLIVGWASRWNAFYLATLAWAFAAVAVQNVTVLQNPLIAAGAGVLALVSLIGVVRSGLTEPADREAEPAGSRAHSL